VRISFILVDLKSF